MREILDQLIETVVQMWDRSDDKEIELEDVLLPLKAALLLAEGESYLHHTEEPDWGIFSALKANKKPLKSKNKRFKFGKK